MPSTITYGGKTTVEPLRLHAYCLEQGLPTDNWWGRANRFLDVRGVEPGTGTLLMTRRNLDDIDVNAEQDLVFDEGTPNGKRTFKRITIAAPPRCVTPGLRGDPAAVYAVDVADRRKALAKIPVDKGYNVLAASGTDYEPETLPDAGGSGGYCYSPDGLWTWQCVVNDLGAILGVGDLPLPYVPKPRPENLLFYGMGALEALGVVLDQIECALTYDQEKDTFAVVELGAADAALDATLQTEDANRRWDADPKAATRPLPGQVRVAFRRYPAPDDGSSPYYWRDVAPPTSVTTATGGGVLWLFDCLGALGATDAPTNAADLNARADERGAKHYQRLLTGEDPLSRRYGGVRTAAALRPGKRVQGIAWLDVGDGLVTEVFRGPAPRRRLPKANAAGAEASDTEFLLTFGQNAVIGDALTGDPWVTVDSDCTDVGAAFYLSAVADVDMASVCLVPRCTAGRVAQPDQPDPPSCQLVWLGGLYQPCFIGGNGTPHYLSAGFPYIARATGQTLAAAIDLRDGDGTQNPDDPLQNVQTLSLPVYITGALPVSMRCDGSTPTAVVGIPTL